MKKHGTKSRSRKPLSRSPRPASTDRSPVRRGSPEGVAGLMDLFRLAGLGELSQRLEGDREALCGPKGRWQADRQAYRHGYGEGCLVLGGRKIRLAKPRVRSVKGEELELWHWQQFAREDPLEDRILEQLVVGVSTRSYPRSLELSGGELEDVATSRSSVSRRFVAQTSRRVEEFLSRPLDADDLPVVMVDGTGFGDHVIIVALGIDSDGHKQRVRPWAGSCSGT